MPVPEPTRKPAGPILWKSAAVLALAATTIFAVQVLSPRIGQSEAGIRMDLPQTLGNFHGTEQPVSAEEKLILPDDTEFAKMLYSDGSGVDVGCQIVLAGSEKRSIHRPEICLPGQGWTITTSQVRPVPVEGGGSLDVTQLIIQRPVMLPNGDTKQLRSLFMYWFVGKDTTTPHHLVRILKTNFDVLFHNTNHRWAYVVVNAPILEGLTPDGKSQEQVEDTLVSFIGRLVPIIMPGQNSRQGPPSGSASG
jgi:EpsI family protein